MAKSQSESTFATVPTESVRRRGRRMVEEKMNFSALVKTLEDVEETSNAVAQLLPSDKC